MLCSLLTQNCYEYLHLYWFCDPQSGVLAAAVKHG